MTRLENSRLLVTPRSFGQYDPSLRTELEAAVEHVDYNETKRPLRADELIERLADCDGMIAGLDEVTAAVIEAAPKLKVIARYGVGVDNVDLDAARAHGVVVTNTPAANAVSVAELTIGLMLALARSIPQADRATRAGEWPRLHGRTLAGKTVGLIGLGAVGRAVAQRLAAFECTLLAYDPYVEPERARQHGVEWTPLAGVKEKADVLSLHCPLTSETRAMIDEAFLTALKPGALLVNTARGELIDEVALAAAVAEGHLGGAGLDTLRREPPEPDNPLLALEQVIITPHSGAHSDGAANAMGRMAVADCLAVLAGEEPRNAISIGKGSRPT